MPYQTGEIDRLAEMLHDANIKYCLQSVPSIDKEDSQSKILLYFGGNDVRTGITFYEVMSAPGRLCSVINYGHGSEEGLLEMSCVSSMMTEEERANRCDVIGYLTAEDIFERIREDWNRTTVVIRDGVLMQYKCCAKEVILPSGIVEIAPRACTFGHIESIEIPRSVKRIGDYAFAGHWDLKTLIIPSSVCDIGRGIVDGADDEYLEIHTAPGTYAAQWAESAIGWHFNDLDADIEYRIENHVAYFAPGTEVVPAHAFYPYTDAADVKEVIIPEGVTTVRYEAFADCSMLERIVYPSTVKTIGDLLIHPAATVKEIVIPYGVEEIAEHAFERFDKSDRRVQLKSLHIPGSVKTIKSWAFYQCSISSLSLDEGIETIEEWAFALNPLREVVLPSSTTNVTDWTFFDDSWGNVRLIRKEG